MNTQDRKIAGDKLKAAFNLLWDESIRRSNKSESCYRDIVRISDAIRAEGAQILGLMSLPRQINASLQLACSVYDPNEERARLTIKNAISGLTGASGLALTVVCLSSLLNPGIWAIVVAFFVGGIAGGPLAIVGITAGLLIAAGSIYAAFQQMTPAERAVKTHSTVMQGIDNWVTFGSKDLPAKMLQEEREPDSGEIMTSLPEASSLVGRYTKYAGEYGQRICDIAEDGTFNIPDESVDEWKSGSWKLKDKTLIFIYANGVTVKHEFVDDITFREMGNEQFWYQKE